jgi:hypothetical protein
MGRQAGIPALFTTLALPTHSQFSLLTPAANSSPLANMNTQLYLQYIAYGGLVAIGSLLAKLAFAQMAKLFRFWRDRKYIASLSAQKEWGCSESPPKLPGIGNLP